MLARPWVTIALALCASGCNGFLACSDYGYARAEDLVTPCIDSGACTLSGAALTPGSAEADHLEDGFGHLDVAPEQSITIPIPSTHPRFAVQPRLALYINRSTLPGPVPSDDPRPPPPPSPDDLDIEIDGAPAHCIIAHFFSEEKYACTLPEGAKELELVYDPASADPNPFRFSVAIYLEEEIPTAEQEICAA